jgi:hypothetical protein
VWLDRNASDTERETDEMTDIQYSLARESEGKGQLRRIILK